MLTFYTRSGQSNWGSCSYKASTWPAEIPLSLKSRNSVHTKPLQVSVLDLTRNEGTRGLALFKRGIDYESRLNPAWSIVFSLDEQCQHELGTFWELKASLLDEHQKLLTAEPSFQSHATSIVCVLLYSLRRLLLLIYCWRIHEYNVVWSNPSPIRSCPAFLLHTSPFSPNSMYSLLRQGLNTCPRPASILLSCCLSLSSVGIIGVYLNTAWRLDFRRNVRGFVILFPLMRKTSKQRTGVKTSWLAF